MPALPQALIDLRALVAQHVEARRGSRLLSAFVDLIDLAGEEAGAERFGVDLTPEQTIARTLRAGLMGLDGEFIAPLVERQAEADAHAEIDDLAERLSAAKSQGSVALDREIAAARSSLALEPALEQIGAVTNPARAA